MTMAKRQLEEIFDEQDDAPKRARVAITDLLGSDTG